MKLKTKIYLVDEDGNKFMGIGVLWLLKAVEASGSLRGGAAELSISYSKAHAMIASLEANLGVPVISRRKGGNEHAGATLTLFGKAFVKQYDDFQTEIKELSASPFKRFSDRVDQLIKADSSGDKE